MKLFLVITITNMVLSRAYGLSPLEAIYADLATADAAFKSMLNTIDMSYSSAILSQPASSLYTIDTAS